MTQYYIVLEFMLGNSGTKLPAQCMLGRRGAAVDWWALGVCLYEFLVGFPPFTDQSPELVFKNILNRNIEWPDGEDTLSEKARSTIEALLSSDPRDRPDAGALKVNTLFEKIDWDNIHSTVAPFVPNPDDDTDTSYFIARNNMQQVEMSDIDLAAEFTTTTPAAAAPRQMTDAVCSAQCVNNSVSSVAE